MLEPKILKKAMTILPVVLFFCVFAVMAEEEAKEKSRSDSARGEGRSGNSAAVRANIILNNLSPEERAQFKDWAANDPEKFRTEMSKLIRAEREKETQELLTLRKRYFEAADDTPRARMEEAADVACEVIEFEDADDDTSKVMEKENTTPRRGAMKVKDVAAPSLRAPAAATAKTVSVPTEKAAVNTRDEIKKELENFLRNQVEARLEMTAKHIEETEAQIAETQRELDNVKKRHEQRKSEAEETIARRLKDWTDPKWDPENRPANGGRRGENSGE